MRRDGLLVGYVVAGALVAVLLAGCGSSTLSARELRRRATLVCTTAVRRSDRISLPPSNAAGAVFLARGITIFRPELTALRKLAPPRSLANAYRVALADSAQQLDALIATDHNLRNGGDPVVAIRQLDVELGPINDRDRASWRTVGAPACANLTLSGR
ncbi:MAG: hypothetical protein QOJ25_2401 [Solirubrobacteraceae bacterium]|nr:hypothetical protein [Solirubrobacteraceae bacterium]